MLTVRRAVEADYPTVAKQAAAAYIDHGIVTVDDDYVALLAQLSDHNTEPSLVLVAEIDGQLAASVVYCPYGSQLTDVCGPGEAEFRMLAVYTGYERQGAALALIEACADIAREQGLTTLVACVLATNEPAGRLYRRLGYLRRPARDWVAPGGFALQTLVQNLNAVYCGRCGHELSARDHNECVAALELEPPRYCEQCKRRMVVQVIPAGWTATCSVHGTTTGTVSLS